MALFKLPQEILSEIYCNLSHTHDAINLALTCTAASDLLRRPPSCRKIMQSIVSSNDRARWDDIYLAVLNRLHADLFLDNPLHRDNLYAASLSDFLAQFDGVESASLVDTIIIKSARYQRKLMDDVPSTATNHRLIIARSLHCCILVSKIAREFSRKCDKDEEIEQYCAQILKRTGTDSVRDATGISSLVFGILKDLEEMIQRGTPNHWPIILTVLCLFRWMSTEFHRSEHELEGLDEIDIELADPLGDLAAPLHTLTRMFYIQMRGDHPFRNSWDYDAYAKLVQHDPCATGQFEMFNNWWLVATCAEDYATEIDLDGKGYQRVDASDSFEHQLQEGMTGWVERVECFCYGPSFLFEAYPPFSASMELWELKALDTDSLNW